MATATQIRSYTFDASQTLKDAGLVAADAAGTVASVARVLTVGEGFYRGVAVIDVTAIETASNDEQYRICIQGSTSPTFASDVQNLAVLPLGATAVNSGGAITSTAGRYELPFTNEQNGVTYPYVREYTDVSGAIATGINFSVQVGLDRLPG